MSDGAACAVALIAGVLFILIATFGIRHVSGFPAFFPDLFNRLYMFLPGAPYFDSQKV